MQIPSCVTYCATVDASILMYWQKYALELHRETVNLPPMLYDRVGHDFLLDRYHEGVSVPVSQSDRPNF